LFFHCQSLILFYQVDTEFLTLPAIILAFYSFGTFGFLNLFGLRIIVQIGVFLFTSFGIVALYGYMFQKGDQYNFGSMYVILFALLYYGLAYSMTAETLFIGLVQTALMIIIFLYLFIAPKQQIDIISQTIIMLTLLFTLMGFFAYINFLIDPFMNYNPNIYDSSIGNATVHATSWIEYFSFTSGDGFNFFGKQITRLKGFCNEPSATIVHYLAPAALCFIYSKQYKNVGLVILLFNLVAISSLMSIIIVFGSAIIYLVFLIKNKKIVYIILSGSLLMLIVMMMYPDFAESFILDMGRSLQEQISYDLIARKNGSVTDRLMSFSIALQEWGKSPFGWSRYSTMTGLLFDSVLKGGIFIFGILVIFFLQIVKYSLIKFHEINVSISYRLGISLVVSTIIVAFLLSSYGWERIPGIIMLMLFYRNLKE